MKHEHLQGKVYRPDIDGLRSIAVLAVVLFHFQLGSALEAGFIGVDIFFVISGFLIITNICKRLDAGTFGFRSFYAARIRRLAPALVATTVLTLIAGLIILTPGELIGLAKETAPAQLYVSNIFYWRTLNYFGLQADQSFLLHTWSLAVEEQFYLFFPVVLWLAKRGRTALLIGILALSLALNLVMVCVKPEATFYLLPTRAWEFAAGAFVPVLATGLSRWRITANFASLAGLVILAFAFWLYDPTVTFPGWFAILPVTGTMFLLAAGDSGAAWYSRAISSTMPVYIGRISYALYLVHWPVRVFAPLLFLDYSIGVRLGALALCFLLAALIYHVVEHPIRSKRVLTVDRRLLRAYAASLIGLLTLVGGIAVLHGLPGRMSPAAQRWAAFSSDADGTFRACEGQVGPCKIGSPDLKPTWLVFGDSHADALARPFSSFLVKQKQAAFLAFQAGCLPVTRTGDENCRSFNARVRSFLTDHPEIRTVVLISTWRQPLEDRYTDSAGRLVRGAAALASFQLSLSNDLRDLAGRRIVVWLPVPGARRSVPTSLARGQLLHRDWDLAFRRVDYDRRFGFLIAELAKHSAVTLIRPADVLCKEGCAVVADGRPLYHDDAHPAASQSPLFERIIEHDLTAK